METIQKPEFMAFAASVRALRTGAKLTQRDLAERANVSATTVSRAERGGEVYLGHALAIAKALGRTLDELMRMEWDTCPRCGGSGVVHHHAEMAGGVVMEQGQVREYLENNPKVSDIAQLNAMALSRRY